MRSQERDYLSRFVPAILVVVFLCDVVFHFVRLDFLTFRGDEAASQAIPLGFRYEPGRRLEYAASNGDISALANLPEYREFRPQVFTTDSFGYRNAPPGAQLPPSVILLGSSFTAGTGNSDEHILARQLEARSGCSVYNAGGWREIVDFQRAQIRRLGMQHGLVLLEVLERKCWGGRLTMRERKSRIPYMDVVYWYYEQATRSRLKIVAQRLYKYLCNDWLLPNSFKTIAVVRELVIGKPMLFFNDMEHQEPPTTLDPLVQDIEQFRDALVEDGHRLAIYLVPDKLTVYRDLVRPPAPRSDMGAHVLADLDRRLRERGIPTVNVEPVLHAAANEAMKRDELIYWSDDTHWNAKGIGIAAAEISRRLDVPAACGKSAATK